jgi:transcriptional regulator with XRE-family HTH domain
MGPRTSLAVAPANPLACFHPMPTRTPTPTSDPALSDVLSQNVRALRQARGMTQVQIANAAAIPRATWANLEAGAANPTLTVLHRVATALAVSIEELLAPPRTAAAHHPLATLTVKKRGSVVVRRLLPHPLPGVELDRMELPPGARMTGVPHTAGTREYLTCERGTIELVASGERYRLDAGDVVSFRGDQRHSYANAGDGTAVGFSIVLLLAGGMR